jgi:hypothetical protein
MQPGSKKKKKRSILSLPKFKPKFDYKSKPKSKAALPGSANIDAYLRELTQ